MDPWQQIIGGALVVFLTIYTLTGGADFGGGVWDLLAFGDRADRQRRLIAKAIGPIWEANHVWLIVMIVVLFVTYPAAFAVLSTALHIPLTIMLFGIVLRGTAFVFRTYDAREAGRQWSLIFAIASIITPFMLGVSLASLSSGQIRVDQNGDLTSGFTAGWTTTFALLTGLMTVVVCALLAAVYLIHKTDDPQLRADFRQRALAAAGALGLIAWPTLWSAQDGANPVAWGLSGSAWSLPFHLLTGLVAVSLIVALIRRRDNWSRIAAPLQVILLIAGWAFSHYPHIITPDFTIAQSAPISVLKLTVWILLGGLPLLIPSFLYLYKIFALEKPLDRT